MKLGRALLSKTKTTKEKDKEDIEKSTEIDNDGSDIQPTSDVKLRRGEEELLSPQQLQQYKLLVKSYEVPF
jgi:hypothetical protein